MSGELFNRRALLLAGAGIGLSLPFDAQAKRRAPTLDEVLHDPQVPVLGNPQGDVTIAEFFEYQCPSCKLVHPHLEKLVADDGHIRFIMKDWPIYGDVSRYASRMALAAQYCGRYRDAAHALMHTNERLSSARVDTVLRAAGIDVGIVRDALELHMKDIDALLARNEAQAKALGLLGTPAFVVGTRLYPRAMHVQDLRQAIDNARG